MGVSPFTWGFFLKTLVKEKRLFCYPFPNSHKKEYTTSYCTEPQALKKVEISDFPSTLQELKGFN
jgi:hypothetical protein